MQGSGMPPRERRIVLLREKNADGEKKVNARLSDSISEGIMAMHLPSIITLFALGVISANVIFVGP